MTDLAIRNQSSGNKALQHVKCPSNYIHMHHLDSYTLKYCYFCALLEMVERSKFVPSALLLTQRIYLYLNEYQVPHV